MHKLLILCILVVFSTSAFAFTWTPPGNEDLKGVYNISNVSYLCLSADCRNSWPAGGVGQANDSWNETRGNTIYYLRTDGLLDNQSWNQTKANALYASISIVGDNQSWNQTYATTLYAPITIVGDNTSWNETRANSLYSTLTLAQIINNIQNWSSDRQNYVNYTYACLVNGSNCPAGVQTIYYGNTSFNVSGQLNKSLANTTIADGNTFDSIESILAGTDLRINFTNVTSFDYVDIREQYSGSVANTVALQLWNYNTSTWDTLETFMLQTKYLTSSTFVLQNPYLNVSKVQLRLTGSAVGANQLLIDYVVLRSNTGASSVGVEGEGITNAIPLWLDPFSLGSSIITQSGNMTTVAGDVTARYVVGGLNSSSLNFTTSILTEGTNLYYTDARAASAVQNTTLLRNTGFIATNITSGTVATARLGSGSASATTFLAGDSTWKNGYNVAFPAANWTDVDISSTVATTWTNTNLSLPSLAASSKYIIDCIIINDAAAATTGVQVAINFTGTAPSSVQLTYTKMSSATAVEGFSGTSATTNAFLATGSNTVASAGNIDGYVQTGAGTANMLVDFRSEVGASAANIRKGSFCRAMKVA